LAAPTAIHEARSPAAQQEEIRRDKPPRKAEERNGKSQTKGRRAVLDKKSQAKKGERSSD